MDFKKVTVWTDVEGENAAALMDNANVMSVNFISTVLLLFCLIDAIKVVKYINYWTKCFILFTQDALNKEQSIL